MECGFVLAGCASGHKRRTPIVCTSRREFVQAALLLPCLELLQPRAASAAKPVAVKLDSGVEYLDVKKGKGNSPQPGDLVVVSYVGYLSDGTVFDNTDTPGRKPLAFRFGQRQVIPGWEEGMVDMKPGGVRTLVIPPDLAYGDRGVCIEDKGCLIPPNETLKYEIKLIRVAISPL